MENVFISNPTAKKLLKFPDGTCFLEANVSDANNYAAQTKTSYEVIEREETEFKPTKTNKK